MSKKQIFCILKYALTGLWWLLLLLGGVCIVIFLSAHFRGEIPRIGDYSVMHIVSPSMEPTIETDSYILIKRVDPERIAKDDVICFYSTDPDIYGYPNTHRVVEEPIVQDGEVYFVTQGDRNSQPDRTMAEGERLIGVHVKNLTVMSTILRFLTNHLMLIFALLFALGAVAVCGSAFLSVKKEKAKSEGAKTKKDT